MTENKIAIVAKDGKALVGNDFHILTDESKLSFETADIFSFLEYLKALDAPTEMTIFFDNKKISAMPAAIEINTIPIGICHLQETDYLAKLREINNKKLSLDATELMMRLFRPFSGGEGKKILDFTRNAHIEDVIKIDRMKSNTGDYEFSVQRKKSGKAEWTCPESITFKVPIFQNIESKEEFTFETSFDYDEVEDGVKMTFAFSCLDFENILNFHKKGILTNLLKDFNCPKYFGNAEVKKMTDEWLYKSNPLTH